MGEASSDPQVAADAKLAMMLQVRALRLAGVRAVSSYFYFGRGAVSVSARVSLYLLKRPAFPTFLGDRPKCEISRPRIFSFFSP